MRELIIPVGDDEYTGKIERVYGINGELIRCKDCKFWDTEDGTFPDIDEKEWHNCKLWQDKTRNKYDCVTQPFHYCSWADRKEE